MSTLKITILANSDFRFCFHFLPWYLVSDAGSLTFSISKVSLKLLALWGSFTWQHFPKLLNGLVKMKSKSTWNSWSCFSNMAEATGQSAFSWRSSTSSKTFWVSFSFPDQPQPKPRMKEIDANFDMLFTSGNKAKLNEVVEAEAFYEFLFWLFLWCCFIPHILDHQESVHFSWRNCHLKKCWPNQPPSHYWLEHLMQNVVFDPVLLLSIWYKKFLN